MRSHAASGALLLGALACNFLMGEPTPPPEADAALGRFAGAEDDLEEAFADLDRLMVEDPSAAEAAALARLDDGDPQVRFAAVFALANTGTSERGERALRELLESRDVTERALAAEALVSRGAREALPVLIDHLADDTFLRFAEPPMEAWAHAQFLLTLYTEQDFGLSSAADASGAAAAGTAWADWWEAEGDRIVWDEASLVFRSGVP